MLNEEESKMSAESRGRPTAGIVGVGLRGWTVARCLARGDRPTTALRPHHGAKGSAVKLLDSKPCSRRTSDPHLKLSLSIRMERVLTIPQIARTK